MDTINRLLKKQASKKRSKDQDETDSINKDDSSTNSQIPIAFHYVSNKDGCTLSIPLDVEIPIKFSKGPNYPPPVPICSVSGCTRPKKYRCVNTLKYACSMEHLQMMDTRVKQSF
ncbi:35532_t:CDS:2 [Racocetra persica]|uniref:35532_t:CDS:1 n=1 Tax=Racocetra persica TaxID=160502 RepID=A0ACA9Q4E7_9GLOM|nr:35532_t:CDS:2 [Racocetra persica]